MSAIWLRLRSELRTRWRSWLGLALVIAVAGGVVLAATAGARRTDTAWERLEESTNASDAFVFGPQFQLDVDAIAALPEVSEVALGAYVAGDYEGYEALGFSPLVSVDGVWLGRVDRPKVLDGRRPRDDEPHEVAITPPITESTGLGVGDTLTLRAFAPDQIEVIFSGEVPEPAGPTIELDIVGVELNATEGELISSARSGNNIHLTPAFWERYAETVGVGPGMWVQLHRGEADLASFRARVERISGGAAVSVTSQTDSGARAKRSIHLQAVALGLFAGLAALAALLTVGQALARAVYLDARDNHTLHALGMTRSQLWAMTALRMGLVGLAGAAGAVVIAALASPLMPFGLARLAEPAPGFTIDTLVLGLGLAVIPLLTLGLAGIPAWRLTALRRARHEDSRSARVGALAGAAARAGLPPSAVAGVRLAVQPGRGPTSAPVRSAVLGAIFSVAALTVAVIFGASLDRLFSTPRLYGWNWDVAVGNAFAEDLRDALVPILSDSEWVGGFSSIAAAEVDVVGKRTPAYGIDTVEGSVAPPIVDGRLPERSDEAVVGTRTLHDVGAGVGDVIEVSVAGNAKSVRVVGSAVFPALGTFESGGPGDWIMFTVDGLRAFVPGAQENVFIVDYAVGADPAAALAGLTEEIAIGPPGLPEAPVEVADFGRVDNMPLVLSGLLALMAVASVAHALLTTVRRRRHDLAILKTLGFVGRQVRLTVAWQATTMMLIALAVGIPVGLAAGRWAWHIFATSLGIVPESAIPVLALVVLVPAALLVANLIAAGPGWAAARTRPSVALRSE